MDSISWHKPDGSIFNSSLRWRDIKNVTIVEIFHQTSEDSRAIIDTWMTPFRRPGDSTSPIVFSDWDIWRFENDRLLKHLRAANCWVGALGEYHPTFQRSSFVYQDS